MLVFELFPAFITVVATSIAIALYVVSRRRRGDPERPIEQPDPSRPTSTEGHPITRSSMRS
jgi:hypothetical protein